MFPYSAATAVAMRWRWRRWWRRRRRRQLHGPRAGSSGELFHRPGTLAPTDGAAAFGDTPDARNVDAPFGAESPERVPYRRGPEFHAAKSHRPQLRVGVERQQSMLKVALTSLPKACVCVRVCVWWSCRWSVFYRIADCNAFALFCIVV